MEMDVHEGQRCEKATGKNKLFRPPYHPASYLASLPRSRGHTHGLFVEMQMCNIKKGNY